MPKTEEEKMDYMGMLETLASEYPELEETAMALSGELDEIMPMGDDMMEDDPDYEEEYGDDEMMDEEFSPIPPELEDEEEEEEFEPTL